MAEGKKIAIEISLDTSRLVADLRAAGDALHAAADRVADVDRLIADEVSVPGEPIPFSPDLDLIGDLELARLDPGVVEAQVTAAGRGHTTDRTDPRLGHGVDADPVEQHDVYLVLSDEERARGFVRPVRSSYVHLVCGAVTTMSLPIAETYAREPGFYGSTYCCTCRKHLPVGEHGEFVWDVPYPPFATKAEYQTWLETVPPKVGT